MVVFSIGFIDGQTTRFSRLIESANQTSELIQQTTDGGYILIGNEIWGAYANGYLAKINSLGDTVWTRQYGDTNYVHFKGGQQTLDGGYIITGSIGYSTTSDIYVLKTDSLGNVLWQKSISGSQEDNACSIKSTSDGGYILSGYSKSYGAGNFDMVVIKLDSIGNIQWNRILGQSGYDKLNSASETSDGGYIVCGTLGASTFIAKLDSTGNTIWQKSFSEVGCFYKGKDAIQTSDGGYIVLGGKSFSPSVHHQVILIKTDSLGTLMWSKKYSNTKITFQDFYSINITQSGKYILAATDTFFMPLLILIENNGATNWARKTMTATPSSTFGTYTKETNDGGFIYTVTAPTTFAISWINIIKTDSLGTSGCYDTTSAVYDSILTPITTALSLSPVFGFSSSTLTINTRWVGRNTSLCSILGISEQKTDPISVYPNPSSGQFNFNGLEKESKIEVFDMSGKIIYQSTASGDFETINISEKAKGIYFYRITKEMKLVQSGKIAMQ